MNWINRSLVLTFTLTGTLVLSGQGFGADEKDAPCKLATKGDSLVAKACKEGGVKAAKKIMKKLTKDAKKIGGVQFDCDDCHKEEGQYDMITDDAREKFKKLLAAAEEKK
jgi:hypothetical protein